MPFLAVDAAVFNESGLDIITSDECALLQCVAQKWHCFAATLIFFAANFYIYSVMQGSLPPCALL